MKHLRKTIMFLVGFCVYITIEVCWRGYSSIVMGIVGGLILLYLDSINQRISWDIDLMTYGTLGSVVATGFELLIGEGIKLLGLKPIWDYSNLPFNFDGVICLSFSIAWFFVSIGGVFIADAINYYVFEELPVPYYKLFGEIVIRFKEKNCKLINLNKDE